MEKMTGGKSCKNRRWHRRRGKNGLEKWMRSKWQKRGWEEGDLRTCLIPSVEMMICSMTHYIWEWSWRTFRKNVWVSEEVFKALQVEGGNGILQAPSWWSNYLNNPKAFGSRGKSFHPSKIKHKKTHFRMCVCKEYTDRLLTFTVINNVVASF